MRYFKVIIVYNETKGDDDTVQSEQVLYCCSPETFPKTDQLRELFYSLQVPGKKYMSASWHAVREEEIPTNEIHLI